MSKANDLASLISDGLIGSAELDTGAVTLAKLSDNSVDATKLDDTDSYVIAGLDVSGGQIHDVASIYRGASTTTQGGIGLGTDGSVSFMYGDTENARFSGEGRLGFGTQAPLGIIDIKNSTTPLIKMGYGGTNAEHKVAWDSTGMVISADSGTSSELSYMSLQVFGTEALHIKSSGRVGIGTNTPDTLLHVAGTIKGATIEGSNTNWDTAYSWGDHATFNYVTNTALDNYAVGGSLVGTPTDLRVQYGVAYNGTASQGSFFFDSLNSKLKVYTGSTWVDAVPAGTGTSGGDSSTTDANATFDNYIFTVAASTNTISGNDDNGTSFAYDVNADVEVFVNGVKQLKGASNDYVATSGTSVNFVENLIAGDVVDVQVYNLLTNDAFYLKTETYSQSETNSQISNAVSSYLPLSGGSVTGYTAFTNQLHVNTATNIYPFSVGRNAGYDKQVLQVGVTDRQVIFNYVEDTDTEGANSFGEFRFDVSGNTVGDTTVTPLQFNQNRLYTPVKTGIGIQPSAKLHVVDSAGLASLAVTDNAFTIGETSGQNLAFDSNEIQSRDNSSASTLILNKLGGSVGIGVVTPASNSQLQVNDGTFTTGSTPTITLGDSYTSWSVPYGDKVRFRAYHGFNWEVGVSGHIPMTLGEAGHLILNRSASSYGGALEFQEAGSTVWRIKPDADGANANELQFTDTAGATKAKLMQDGTFRAEAFQQGTTPLGYLHQSPPMMQGPAGSQLTPFSGWSKPFGTYTEEFRINSGVAWDSRSAEEQELLTAMGRWGVKHLVPSPIIVYRLTMPSGRGVGGYFGAYHNTKYWYDRYTTIAAFTKVLSGPGMSGYWANGCTTEWKLTGQHLRGSGGGYTNCHPYALGPDSATVMLVALPAVVEGHVDLSEPRNWWFFTNRDGGWG